MKILCISGLKPPLPLNSMFWHIKVVHAHICALAVQCCFVEHLRCTMFVGMCRHGSEARQNWVWFLDRVHGRTLMWRVFTSNCRHASKNSQSHKFSNFTCAYLKCSAILLNCYFAPRSSGLLGMVEWFRNTYAVLGQSSRPFPEPSIERHFG